MSGDNKDMFSPSILGDVKSKLSIELEDNFELRPLNRDDYNHNYCGLLSQLKVVGNYEEKKFLKIFDQMQSSGEYYIIVIYDKNNQKCVASSSLITEYKFTHNCSIRGRIEEVIVDSEYRNKHFGSLLIKVLNQLAIDVGCYKITLDCKDEMISFYQKFGLVKEKGNGNLLTKRFNQEDCS